MPLDAPCLDDARDMVLRYVAMWSSWQGVPTTPDAGIALWHRIVMGFETAGWPLTCIERGDVLMDIADPGSDDYD